MMKIVSVFYFTIHPFILKNLCNKATTNYFKLFYHFDGISHFYLQKQQCICNCSTDITLWRVDFRIHGELVHINITRTVKCRALKMTPKNPPQVRERVGLLHSKYVPSTSCDARPECRAQNIFYGQFDDSSTRQIILHFWHLPKKCFRMLLFSRRPRMKIYTLFIVRFVNKYN